MVVFLGLDSFNRCNLPILISGGNSLLVLSVAIVLNIDANERRNAMYQGTEVSQLKKMFLLMVQR